MNSPAGLPIPYLIFFVVCLAVSLLIDSRTRSMPLSLIPIVLVLMVSLWLKDMFWVPTQATFSVTLVCMAYIGIRIWLSVSRLKGGQN